MRLRPDHPRIHHLLQRAVFRLQTRPRRPEPRAHLTPAAAPHRPGVLTTPRAVGRSRTLTRVVVVEQGRGAVPVHRAAGVHACGVVPGEDLRLLHTGPHRALVEGMDDFVLCGDTTLLALDFDGFGSEGLVVEVLTSPALVAAARRDADRLLAAATPYATYLARGPALCP